MHKRGRNSYYSYNILVSEVRSGLPGKKFKTAPNGEIPGQLEPSKTSDFDGIFFFTLDRTCLPTSDN